MKRRLLLIGLVFIVVLFMGGCASKESKAFKEEYEALNGQVNAAGKEHRTISIPADNPYVKVTAKDIVDKINNGETFYVYFGDPLCPWCRSVLEKSIEVAKQNNVKTIYYVKVWDEEGNEVLRSKYKLDDSNNIELVVKGTDEYYILLEKFGSLLSDYTLSTSEGEKIQVGEKRIFAPNYVYVKDGKPIKLEEGISEKQTDSRGELTEEILKDEEDLFNAFFNN